MAPLSYAMRNHRSRRLVFAIICSGCGGGTEPTPPPPPPPPPPPAPVALTAVSPQFQSLQVGLSLNVGVRLTTTSGTPVAGALVLFIPAAGGADPATALSDAGGFASTVWTIGTIAGTNTLAASTPNATPVQFTAVGTPGSPSGLRLVQGSGQSATVATAVPVQPSAQVTDNFGNGVSNISVTFAVGSGGGSITGSTTTTNDLGVATVGSWTLGTVSGPNTLTATAAAFPPVTFTVTGTADAAVALGLPMPPVGGPSGALFTQQPAIALLDRFGNLVLSDNGRAVTAAITPGGNGTLTGTTTVSTVNGVATFGNLLIVGTPSGSRSLTFTSSGFTPLVSDNIALSPSPSLTVTDVTPAVLTPGSVATISGTGFNVVPGANTVTVDGVGLAVTAASATQLTVALPVSGFLCTPLHYAVVAVANGANSAANSRQLRTATPRVLSVGDLQLLLNESDLACNELASGGQYILTVFHSGGAQGALGFQIRGGRFGAGPAPEAASETALGFAPFPPGPVDKHMAHLEYERARYARVGPSARAAWRSLRSGPSAHGASLVTPTVGATSQVRFGFDDTGTTILNVRTAFVGPHLIIAEDQAISPTFGTTPFDAFYAQLGNEFETRIFPILTTNFGNPLAMDAVMHNTGRVLLVFTPSVNAIGGVAGFVSACDAMVVAMCDASNEAPATYLHLPDVGSDAASVSFWKSDILMVVQHEAKHITAVAERMSRSAPALEESWLEEGTAEIALEIYGRQICGFGPKARTGFAALLSCEISSTYLPPLSHLPDLIERLGYDFYDYLLHFETSSPFGSQTVNGQFVPFHYESAWSMARWAADAFGGSDPAFFKPLIQDVAHTGMANLAAHTGQSQAALIGLWTMMLDTDDRDGLAATSPSLSFSNWRVRDLASGVRSVYGLQTPSWPLAVKPNPSPQGWAYNVQFLVAGSASFVELGAAGETSQVFELKAFGNAGPVPAGTPLRIGIQRIK